MAYFLTLSTIGLFLKLCLPQTPFSALKKRTAQAVWMLFKVISFSWKHSNIVPGLLQCRASSEVKGRRQRCTQERKECLCVFSFSPAVIWPTQENPVEPQMEGVWALATAWKSILQDSWENVHPAPSQDNAFMMLTYVFLFSAILPPLFHLVLGVKSRFWCVLGNPCTPRLGTPD